MRTALERVLGAPVAVQQLKHKPGRRTTLRALGPRGRAIVKLYASPRAPAIAARLAALAEGPAAPRLPRVLAVDLGGHALVLSEVPGPSLGEAVLAGDAGACQEVGEVLGRWHGWWRLRPPAALVPHPLERELAIVRANLAAAPAGTRAAAGHTLRVLGRSSWPLDTVVHRDLYEEQVILGERVGLIDLDDAAVGPAELDMGYLLAHMDLLGRRAELDPQPMQAALLEGYSASGFRLGAQLVRTCRALSLIRLACIHRREELAWCAHHPPRAP